MNIREFELIGGQSFFDLKNFAKFLEQFPMLFKRKWGAKTTLGLKKDVLASQTLRKPQLPKKETARFFGDLFCDMKEPTKYRDPWLDMRG